MESRPRASGRRRHGDADRHDVAALADRAGSRAPALDALDYSGASREGNQRYRFSLHHRRQQRQTAAGATAGMARRRCARHGYGDGGAPSRPEPADRLQGRSVPQAAIGRRLHRLHVGQVPADRRRAVAGPPADDEERRAGDGRSDRVHGVTRGWRCRGDTLRRLGRLEARLDDVDDGRRGSARHRDRAAGDRPAERRAVVRAPLAGLRRMVQRRQGLRAAADHELDGDARVSRADAHRGALRVQAAADAA